MSRESGWPIPPAAPKMATFRSGADPDANPRRVTREASEEFLRSDLNIDDLISISSDLRAEMEWRNWKRSRLFLARGEVGRGF